MSLILDTSKPEGLSIKTFGIGDGSVYLGNYEISPEDFLVAVHYVLTNTDLVGENDPRIQFVKSVQAMKEIDGYTSSRKRLYTEVSPVPKSYYLDGTKKHKRTKNK